MNQSVASLLFLLALSRQQFYIIAMKRRILLANEDDLSDLGFGAAVPHRSSGISQASSGRLSASRLSSVHRDEQQRNSASPGHPRASGGASSSKAQHIQAEVADDNIRSSSASSAELAEETWPIVSILINGITVAVSTNDGQPQLDDPSLSCVPLLELQRARLAADRITRKFRDMISQRERDEAETVEGSSSEVEDALDSSDESFFDSDSDFDARRKRRKKRTLNPKKKSCPSVKKHLDAEDSVEQLTRPQLQEILKAAKLKISGRKSMLVQRVRQHREGTSSAHAPPAVESHHPVCDLIEGHASPHRLSTPHTLSRHDEVPTAPASDADKRCAVSESPSPRASLTQKIGFVTPSRIFKSFKDLFYSSPQSNS